MQKWWHMSDEFETIKNRDYILFLDVVLDLCRAIAKKHRETPGSIQFSGGNVMFQLQKKQGHSWGSDLCYCAYECMKNKMKLKIIIDNAQAEEIQIKNRVVDVAISGPKYGEEEKIKEAVNELKQQFINQQLIEELQGKLNKFLSKRTEVLEKKNIFLVEEKDIAEYLESYFNVLQYFVAKHDSFAEIDTSLPEQLLHIDMEAVGTPDRKNYSISFWAPMALNKIQKVNRGIEDFYERIIQEESENEALEILYKRILLKKVQHTFRWYVAGENRELMHAAITPYRQRTAANWQFHLPAKNIRQYNSYEGIGELRLAEKILCEYQRWQPNTKEDFNVAIVGDVFSVPTEELYNYVKYKAFQNKNPKSEGNFKFHIYTKNQFEAKEENKEYINKCEQPDEVLTDKEKLKDMIESNNLVFLLDCVELYKNPKSSEAANEQFYKQKFAVGHYQDSNIVVPKYFELAEKNALDEIYEALTAYICYGTLGRIEKFANEELLNFCEIACNESSKRTTLYAYVSDLRAFAQIYNNDQYCIRTEKYHEKEIGIIRYSDEKVETLPLEVPDKVLVFNMWQFVKHIAIDERNSWAENLIAQPMDYRQFESLCIGINYEKWPEFLEIHYYIDIGNILKENYKIEEALINAFLDKILLPILNNRNRNMFHEYIRKAMYSFFYGDAKSVNDMLFIHLFQDEFQLLGEAKKAKEKNDIRIVNDNINRQFKYSSKRFYDMVIRNYDISSTCYIGQIRTARMIAKNEKEHYEFVNKEIVYGNVIKACENLGYEDSYLKRNCEREMVAN